MAAAAPPTPPMPVTAPAAAEPPSGRYHPGDDHFLDGVRDAQLTQATPGATWALYLMCLVVLVGVVWASLAHVDEVTRAEGKVIPDGREQVIASLEGGILGALLVREGMIVEAGQDLLRLDPTRLEAQQAEWGGKLLALKAQAARLEAEATGRPLSFPDELGPHPGLTSGEADVFRARRSVLDEGVASIRTSLGLLNRELGISRRMAQEGLVSSIDVMRLERQANDMRMQILERTNRFRQEAASELVRVRTDIAQLQEQMVVKQDLLARSVLKSPVRGVVKNIRIGTVGGVVSAGAPIMEILPIGPKVLVEARIKPADIGFVQLGQKAEVKLATYDYFIYGGLKGTIDYISPDALDDGSSRPDQTYYRAVIRSETPVLKAGNRELSVIPGMTATVEIRNGERTVMDYLLRPLLKSREAFRER